MTDTATAGKIGKAGSAVLLLALVATSLGLFFLSRTGTPEALLDRAREFGRSKQLGWSGKPRPAPRTLRSEEPMAGYGA